MDRINDILNEVAQAASEKYGGKKRSNLKDSDFLFPETRSFPIVSPQDVKDAISNFGRMKGNMSYEAFLRKLYNKCKNKGPEFVAALPQASKDKLGIKKTQADGDTYNDINDYELGPTTMKNLDDLYGDDEENDTMTNHLTAMYHCVGIVMNELKNPDTHKRLTNAGWHDKIQAMSKTTGEMKDFVMNVPLADDDKTLIAGDKPGLWDNIRKKKEKEGKNYRPAKPGDKDRPDSDQWKKLTK